MGFASIDVLPITITKANREVNRNLVVATAKSIRSIYPDNSYKGIFSGRYIQNASEQSSVDFCCKYVLNATKNERTSVIHAERCGQIKHLLTVCVRYAIEAISVRNPEIHIKQMNALEAISRYKLDIPSVFILAQYLQAFRDLNAQAKEIKRMS